MTPTWFKCSSIMPPDNTTDLIIAHSETEGYQVGTGAMLLNLFSTVTINWGVVNPDWRWTVYTDELWDELKRT